MNNNLFEALFQQSAIAMVIARLDGRFLYMNDAFCLLLGYKKEELMNETYEKFTYKDDMEENEEILKKLLNGDIPNYQTEKRYIHKHGHIVWAVLSVNLINDEEGNPIYLIGQIQDITEKKEMEAKLIESEKNYRLIAENSTDRIIVLNKQGIYKYISPSLTIHLGYKILDLVGLGPVDLIEPDDREQFIKALTTVRKSNLTMSITYRIRHKNGHYLWTEANLKCIEDINGCKDILLICRDITQRKQIEKKLSESNEKIHKILESISDGFFCLR